MPRVPETLLFLPGASGNRSLWQPIAERLPHRAKRKFMGWPGFGGVPADPAVDGFDAMIRLVTRELTEPVAIFAQSMGGTIALSVALERPEYITHLVLSVTAGGLDVAALGAVDWRPQFRRENPEFPPWFENARLDLTARLDSIQIPTLLLWGNADSISPVAVGRRLQELLAHAELIVVDGGTHDLAAVRAAELIAPIQRHLDK